VLIIQVFLLLSGVLVWIGGIMGLYGVFSYKGLCGGV